MNIEEIKERAKWLVEIVDNPYCLGPLSLHDGVKEVIPFLLAEVDRLTERTALLDATIAGQENLQRALSESQRREIAAVEDLSTYKDCGFCIHLQDQQYCYKNCQRHVDADNFRTHPCWQWRGVEEGEKDE